MEDTARLPRLLDVLSGGSWGVAEDREAAKAIDEAWPKCRDAIRFHNRFRSAAAEDAVRRGITFVVLAEAGFPLDDAPHLAAARATPDATFVYADRSGIVAGQRRRSLDDEKGARTVSTPGGQWSELSPTPGGHATALEAGIREPRKLLRTAGLLSADGEWLGDGPAHVQLGLAALEMNRGEAAAVTADLARLLPSGSEIVIAVADGGQGQLFAKLAGLHPHEARDLRAWIRRARLKSGALVDVRAYGRTVLGKSLRPGSGRIMAAVARVP